MNLRLVMMGTGTLPSRFFAACLTPVFRSLAWSPNRMCHWPERSTTRQERGCRSLPVI